MKEVIDFKFQLGYVDIFSAELFFELDQLILELDPQLPLVIEIIFELLFGLFELLSLIFKHEFDFPKVVVFI